MASTSTGNDCHHMKNIVEDEWAPVTNKCASSHVKDAVSTTYCNPAESDDKGESYLEGSEAHSPGDISIASSADSGLAKKPGSCCDTYISQDGNALAEADDDSYQSLFPLSVKPWSDSPSGQQVSIEMHPME